MWIAELDEESIEKLQALEEEIGAVIVAMKPVTGVAPLSKEQAERLRALESELGLVLLAVQAK